MMRESYSAPKILQGKVLKHGWKRKSRRAGRTSARGRQRLKASDGEEVVVASSFNYIGNCWENLEKKVKFGGEILNLFKRFA